MHLDINASAVLLPNLLNAILGPYHQVEAMAAKLGAERRPLGTVDFTFVLPCECRRDAPPMVFTLGGGGKILLNPFDYIVPNTPGGHTGAMNAGETCRLALRPDGSVNWLFGSRFLNSHCISVDYDRRRIAFAKSLPSFSMLYNQLFLY